MSFTGDVFCVACESENFHLSPSSEKDGRHICMPCAVTLYHELVKILSEEYLKSVTIINCAICGEDKSEDLSGFGIVRESGDYHLRPSGDPDVRHICQPCAKRIHQDLTEIFEKDAA